MTNATPPESGSPESGAPGRPTQPGQTAPTPEPSASGRRPVVAIDGPAASGKSTIGARVAAELGYRFLDTGLLYRAVTDLALRRGLPLDDPAALVPLVDEVVLVADEAGRLSRVLVAGLDVTDEIRGAAVDRSVSEVSRVPEVRTALLDRQRSMAAAGRIVMAGRDIGTVVLPDADVKIFLDATAEERARRRSDERDHPSDSPEASGILEDLRRRDDLDRNRAVAPLRPAVDARVVETDGNSVEQTVATVCSIVRDVVAAMAAGEEPADEASPELPQPGPSSRHRTDREPIQESARRPPPELHDRPDWIIRGTDLAGRIIYRGLARLEFQGLENLAGLDGPLLVISNHVSNADAPLIGSFLTPLLGRRIHWLGKQEALAWPLVGPMLARNAVIGIRRGSADVEAFRAAKRVLDEGHVLCIFPEGTRSPNGALQEAKEGTTILALRTHARILPLGIAGTRRVWPRGQRLPHPGGKVVMRIGEPFTVSVTGTGAERRAAQVAATTEIMGRIAALLPAAQRGVYAGSAGRAHDRTDGAAGGPGKGSAEGSMP